MSEKAPKQKKTRRASKKPAAEKRKAQENSNQPAPKKQKVFLLISLTYSIDSIIISTFFSILYSNPTQKDPPSS
jgi:hypothetical protein